MKHLSIHLTFIREYTHQYASCAYTEHDDQPFVGRQMLLTDGFFLDGTHRVVGFPGGLGPASGGEGNKSKSSAKQQAVQGSVQDLDSYST